MRVHAGSLTDRLIDWLSIEGGWWATSLMYDHFNDVELNHLRRSLQRLKGHGVVESRPLHEPTYQMPQPEHEWRYVE